MKKKSPKLRKTNKQITIRDGLTWARRLLSQSSVSPEVDSLRLLSHVLQTDEPYLHAHPEKHITPQELKSLEKLIKKRQKHEPVSYIIGEKEFYGLKFKLTSATFIPRPETELLVDEALSIIEAKLTTKKSLRIVEVGTGSGNISISVSHALQNRDKFKKCKGQIELYASDISKAALKIARSNYKKLLPTPLFPIRFIHSNLLEKLPSDIDLLIANLPYIPDSEFEDLDPSITEYEPTIALLGGKNGLELHERLFKQAKAELAKKAIILLEIHHRKANAIRYLTKEILPDSKTKLKKDYSDLDRIVVIRT